MNNNYRISLLLAAVLLASANIFALDGSWRGNLSVGGAKLPLVLNFSQQNDIKSCTLDSPNQNAFGLPATIDYLSTDSVAVSLSALGAKFAGRIKADEIEGQFYQRGLLFPLTLTRELSLQERRPQTPQSPYPYLTIDTIFYSSDHIELSGTFAIPSSYKCGITPMCVLITGSGPQNRDEEIFEHKPFAVIADYLARNGVATFRYDDRGIAASKGNFASSTIDTFIEDAQAALQFAKSFGKGPTGAIGHSEGGTISLILAQNRLTDFVVSLAGMAVSGKETVLDQNRHALQQSGLDAAVTDNALTLISEIFDEIMRQKEAGENTPMDIDAMAARLGVTLPAPLMQSLKSNMATTNAYFASLLSTDARKGMSHITCPVLALNGSLDTQVDADANLDAIKKGIKDTKAVKLPGLNHLFQHATTGDVNEYGEIRETFSPEALSIILQFIQAQQ